MPAVRARVGTNTVTTRTRRADSASSPCTVAADVTDAVTSDDALYVGVPVLRHHASQVIRVDWVAIRANPPIGSDE